MLVKYLITPTILPHHPHVGEFFVGLSISFTAITPYSPAVALDQRGSVIHLENDFAPTKIVVLW